MPNVLIVDDNRNYLEELEQCFGRSQMNVVGTSTAYDAIATALRIRPKVLVSDWMLNDQLTGGDLAELIRIIEADLRVVLISGFSASSQRISDGRATQFLEKPFDMTDIRSAVSSALTSDPVARSVLPIGLIEIVDDGSIGYVNRYAAELVAEVPPAIAAAVFSALIAGRGDRLTAVPAPVEQQPTWTKIRIPGRDEHWHVRLLSATAPDRQLLLMIHDRDSRYRISGAVQHLSQALSRTDDSGACIPAPEPPHHVLLLDADTHRRRELINGLRSLDCFCLEACSFDEAADLLARDEKIGCVVTYLDDAEGKFQRLRNARSRLRVVGVTTRADMNPLAGCDAVTATPLDLDMLAELIDATDILEITAQQFDGCEL